MPLFTVSGPSSGSRKLVIADSLRELVRKGTDQLNLPQGDYSVLYERDEVVVDSDDILLMLADMDKKNPLRVTLTTTADDTNQEKDVLSVMLPVFNSGDEIVIEDTNSQQFNDYHEIQNSQIGESNSSLNSAEINLPWNRFPRNLLRAVEDKKIPQGAERRKMVQEIVDFMDHELNDLRRKTAFDIAKTIVRQYPESFADRINGKLVGDGSTSLANQVYSRIMFINRLKKSTGRPKSAATEETVITSNCIDIYGCAAYQPVIPVNETMDTLLVKKQLLLEEMVKERSDANKLISLLRDTYPLQRLCFNNRSGLVRDCLKEWQILTESQALGIHTNILLGKDIEEEFEKYLPEVGPKFIEYIKMLLAKNKLTNEKKHPRTKELEMWLKDAEDAAQNLRSEFPKSLAVFPALTCYFDESLADLLIVHNAPVTEDIVDTLIGDVITPILVIEGKSLFDEDVKCYILIEKHICLSTKNPLKGFKFLFLAYYIFNLKYNDKIKKTLEFIQRFFFDINPETISKSACCKRSRKNPINWDVRKLWTRMNSAMD